MTEAIKCALRPEDISWAARIAGGYDVTADITYMKTTSGDVKLDVYQPVGTASMKPTLMFMHGGA
jgi:acetyl esterase/lipase